MSLSIVSRVPSRLALPSRGHELGGLMEPHAQSHVNRLHAQPDREMRLAAHGLAVEHQVLRPRCNQLRIAFLYTTQEIPLILFTYHFPNTEWAKLIRHLFVSIFPIMILR